MLAPFEQLQGDTIIVIHHVLAVTLGCVGAGPLMKDRFYARQLTLQKALSKYVFMQIIGNVQVNQINEFIAVCEVIDNQNVVDAPYIQAFYNIAANETGTSGNHNHLNSPTVTTDVPNLPTATPPARLAHATASSHDNPAARISASVANTVSPAPETSNTS